MIPSDGVVPVIGKKRKGSLLDTESTISLPPELNPKDKLATFKISQGVTLYSDNKVLFKGVDQPVPPLSRGVPSKNELLEHSMSRK